MELDYDRLDPEIAVILPALPEGLANITRESIVALRETMAANAPPPPPTDVVITERTAPSPDGDVKVYVHRRPSDEIQPCLLWIHGGGYILGSALDNRATWIAEALDLTVVSVDYRLAPEAPFPAGTEDCWTALNWIVEQADDLRIDLDRLAIGGASAGGGMAAGLALLNRDRGGPKLAMQLLIYPMIDNLHDTPSGQYTNHPVWNRRTSFNAWEMYLDGAPGKDASPYACAARATNLEGLPPAYVCVGAEDLFRDEDIDYARRLIAAGVPCELSVYPGLFHGADGFLPTARISRRLEQGYQAALAQALGL
ncbi:MAG: alpha/beta hydrolase [bacterium]|nr:alpha/beta hydrolase [bacterium]